MSKIASEAHEFEDKGGAVLEVTSDLKASREEMLNKHRNDEKLPTEAFKLFHQSLAVVSVFGTFLGAGTKYEWKCNLRFAILIIISPFTWSQFFYTQFLYLYQGNNMRNLEVIAMYGIAVSYFLKINCFVKYFKNITALYKSTIKTCEGVSGLRLEKLKITLQASFTFYKCLSFLAMPSTVMYTFYPIKSYICDGKLVSLMPMEIMFIDQSTQVGFLTANALMAILGVYTIAITIYMTMHFIILVMSYTIRGDIVEIDFNDLDGLWRDKSTSTEAHRHMFLRNICEKCIDMRGYVEEIKNIFDEKLLLFFIFSYLSQILCMYEIRVNNWVPGYAVAVGMFLEMILYCLMGTQITIQNDRLRSIITQSKWYTYDVHSQKLIVTLLNLAMNSPELWIGPFKPLSVFTATEIIKSIFSYYTIMVELI